MKPKTDKLLKGLLGSSVALMGLTACTPAAQEELFSTPTEPDPNVQPEVTPPPPDEADCDTWKWDEEAEGYQCVAEDNPNRGQYYYGGMWFPTIAAFMAGRAMGGGGTRQPAATKPRTDPNVSQPNPNPNQQKAPNQTNNPRSGMGGGGIFGG